MIYLKTNEIAVSNYLYNQYLQTRNTVLSVNYNDLKRNLFYIQRYPLEYLDNISLVKSWENTGRNIVVTFDKKELLKYQIEIVAPFEREKDISIIKAKENKTLEYYNQYYLSEDTLRKIQQLAFYFEFENIPIVETKDINKYLLNYDLNIDGKKMIQVAHPVYGISSIPCYSGHKIPMQFKKFLYNVPDKNFEEIDNAPNTDEDKLCFIHEAAFDIGISEEVFLFLKSSEKEELLPSDKNLNKLVECKNKSTFSKDITTSYLTDAYHLMCESLPFANIESTTPPKS